MADFKIILAIVASLALVACGGKTSSDGAASKGLESAEKAKNVDQAVEVYSVHLNKIADAIESIESESDADKAAKIIAEATGEFEILADKFSGANKMQMAMALAKQANEVGQPQMRIAVAVQDLASNNPEYLERIETALREMPKMQ